MAKDDTRTNHIHTFFHCASCMRQKPRDKSPQEWNQTETGITAKGIQTFCRRCGLNVVHLTPAQIQEWVDRGPVCASPRHGG